MNMKEIATLFGVEEKDKSMKNKTKAVEITSAGLKGLDKNNHEIMIEADVVLCAAGMKADTALADLLRKTDVNLYVIGDACHPGKVTQAVFDGYYCAKYL